jgi:glycosyltransferase involved in cell wall biosynthesis
MTATPRVTIGLPVYNGEPFVATAIEALLAQTFTDFELIISNNGSTDRTAEICGRYAARDPRIRLVNHEKNRGAIANFTFVREEARAEYFMWAAADDYWYPRFLERCVAELDAHPDACLCFTGFEIVSRKIPFARMRRSPDFSFVLADDPFERVSRFLLLSGRTHKANAIYGLWRRERVVATGRALDDIPEEMAAYGSDYALLAFALAKWKFAYVPELLFRKRSKWFPLASFPDILMHKVLRAIGYLKEPPRQRKVDLIDAYMQMVRGAVARAGEDSPRYEGVFARHRVQMLAETGVSDE